MNAPEYVKLDLSKTALQGFPELREIALREGAVRTALVTLAGSEAAVASGSITLRAGAEFVAIKAPTLDGTEIWIVAKNRQADFERAMGFGDRLSTPLISFRAEKLAGQTASDADTEQSYPIVLGQRSDRPEATS